VTEVTRRILAHLEASGHPFQAVHHAAAHSAREAAELRGTPLEIGGKSLVMKLDRGIGFAVLALPGHRAVHNRMLRHHLRVRRYRFATLEELDGLTGLKPGSVPPFGRPIFDLPLYVDAGLAAAPRIAFTAGSREHSVVMQTEDWLAVARPTDVFEFTRDP